MSDDEGEIPRDEAGRKKWINEAADMAREDGFLIEELSLRALDEIVRLDQDLKLAQDLAADRARQIEAMRARAVAAEKEFEAEALAIYAALGLDPAERDGEEPVAAIGSMRAWIAECEARAEAAERAKTEIACAWEEERSVRRELEARVATTEKESARLRQLVFDFRRHLAAVHVALGESEGSDDATLAGAVTAIRTGAAESAAREDAAVADFTAALAREAALRETAADFVRTYDAWSGVGPAHRAGEARMGYCACPWCRLRALLAAPVPADAPRVVVLTEAEADRG